MRKDFYNVIGVMSGTSLDGIDLARVTLQKTDGNWEFELFECETIAYEPAWIHRLQNAVNFNEADLSQLNLDYTKLLGGIIREFIERHQLKKIDAVCSHGHTVLHQPQNGITLQIGNLSQIAEIIGENVVCNFRVQDVEFGGQGAPLVPIGDRLLFADYDFCLNLGGFSNISFEEDNRRIAFDISAVNTVLNHYANKIGHDYDDRGKMASGGKLNNQLLEALNSLDYYALKFPKSLGFEYVQQTLLPLIDSYKLEVPDVLHSFCEHVALQISRALPRTVGKMLVSGGGAYNTFLLNRMKIHMPRITAEIPDKTVLEFKEALIFALLGVLRLRGEINVLASVTGAQDDHSSGVIFQKPA